MQSREEAFGEPCHLFLSRLAALVDAACHPFQRVRQVYFGCGPKRVDGAKLLQLTKIVFKGGGERREGIGI